MKTNRRRFRLQATAAFIIGLSVALVTPPCRADVKWQTDYAKARESAKRSGRPLLMDFSATWCGPCKEMERTTFSDAEVQKRLARFVCVRIDIDREPALAKQFGVNSIPRVIVSDARGRRLMDALGYREAADFKTMLASALAGKPVIDSGAATGEPAIPPELKALVDHLQAKDYAVWKARQPAIAAKATALLTEQLGAFDSEERIKAAALLSGLGNDGVLALLGGLADSRLAIRVGSFDTLTRLLTDEYRVAPAAIPHYDPWAAASERARMAQSLKQWWGQRRTAGTGKAL